MKIGCRPAHLIVFLLALAGGSLAAAEKWLHARTPHFEMLSSAPEAESRRILAALEQFRASFLATFPFPGANEPRTTIVVFGSERQFRPYRPLYEGKPKEVAGYFLPGRDEVMIAMTTDVGGEDADPTEVIYHEYVHLLIHARELRLPVWLNEGLAELYSTFLVNGRNVEFGAAKDRHVATLSRSPLLPLGRLFAVSHQSPDYNESQRAGIFYAQSWALTHFLVCGVDRSYAPKFNRYLELLSRTEMSEQSFRDAFGADYRALELELRAYLDGGRYYKRTVPAQLPDLTITFTAATDLQRELALANLRWRIHRAGDTAFRAHELARLHPTAARPHELLAAVAAGDDEAAIALDHLKTAAELLSDNPQVYVELLRDGLKGHHAAAYIDTRLPEERIAWLRGLVQRALALDADNADALELGALVEALAENVFVPMVNRVQARVLTMRNPARTMLALAIIRWKVGDTQTAADIVDHILSQRRADLPVRSAANQLRLRLPGGEPANAPSGGSLAALTAEELAARAAVALQTGRRGTAAATLVDRLLVERGSTAPRVALDPMVVAGPPSERDTADRAAVAAQRERAGAGDAQAMFEVALAHATGRGADFSPVLAFDWAQRARESNHILASEAFVRDEADVDAVCAFLRQQRAGSADDSLPPLDRELKAQIERLAAEMPRRPLSLEHRVSPRYPAGKLRSGARGTALVQFRLDPRGTPQLVTVAQASDAEYASAAEEAVRQWRFIPAIRDRVPVSTEVEVLIRFEAAN